MDKRNPTLPLYVTLISIVGLAVAGRGFASLDDASLYSTEFLLLSTGVVVGEFVRIRIPHGRQTIMVTVGDPFTLALLFTMGLGPAMAAKILASVIDDVVRRQVWWKLLFNVGQFSLSLVLGYAALTSISTPPIHGIPMKTFEIAAALFASFAYFFVNMALVTVAIAIATGTSTLKLAQDHLKTRVIHQGALILFTPVVIAALDHSLALFPLLLIPIVVVYHSGVVTHQHVVLADQMGELYEATRTRYGSVSAESWIRDLLERVCAMFEATNASITLLGRGDEQAMTTRIDLEAGGFQPWEPERLDPREGLWARVVSEDRPALLEAPIQDERLRAFYERQGIKDIMVAPMRTEDEVSGVIRVANKAGRAPTFTKEDLNLFETLANHVSIALENHRLIDELEHSLAHLSEMNRLKDDFVASVSHELRTPLTSIQGYVKTLLRPDAAFRPEDVRSFLETIDRQGGRLHRLIEDLLAVSRIESEGAEVAIEAVPLTKVIGDVLDELRSRIEGRDLQVTVVPGLPEVETDVGKVHQIVCNLIDNAIKYSPEGTPVRVEARGEGAGVMIAVTDQGEGIPLELQDRIFERFYQVDQSSTRRVGGAGLGLYICRKLAEAIGGRLWLESSEPGGSCFCLWLPDTLPGHDRPFRNLEQELQKLTNLS